MGISRRSHSSSSYRRMEIMSDAAAVEDKEMKQASCCWGPFFSWCGFGGGRRGGTRRQHQRRIERLERAEEAKRSREERQNMKKIKKKSIDETPRSPSSTSKETAEIPHRPDPSNALQSPIQLESFHKETLKPRYSNEDATTANNSKSKKKTPWDPSLFQQTTKKPRKVHPAKVRQQKLAKEAQAAAAATAPRSGKPTKTPTTSAVSNQNKSKKTVKPEIPKASSTTTPTKAVSPKTTKAIVPNNNATTTASKALQSSKPAKTAATNSKTASVASSFPAMSQTTLPRHNLSRLPDPYYDSNSITSVDEYLAREQNRKQTAPIDSIDTFFQKTAKKNHHQQHPDDEDVSVLTMDPTLQAISRREAEGLITYPKQHLSAMEEEQERYDPTDDLSEIAPLDLVSL